MDFSYYNNQNKINNIVMNAGAKWDSIKIDNKSLKSIFDIVKGGEEYISEEQLKILKNLFKIADRQTSASNKNNIIETEESDKLLELINNSEHSRIIDTSRGEKLDYSFVQIIKDMAFIHKVDSSSIDMTNLPKGKYYIDWDMSGKKDKNGVFVEKLRPLKMQDPVILTDANWSEGLNRQIRVIKISARNTPEFDKLKNELEYIGKEVGFRVETVPSVQQWIEDYTIRRADGKVYIQYNNNRDFIENDDMIEIKSKRDGITNKNQGGAAVMGSTVEYAKTVPQEEKVISSTYLEGGNVLNTLTANGTPGAIIGEESIGYTIKSMGLEINPENTVKAKQEIAKDLGLNEKDIIYIPQFDFHIDMLYHPLGNGEIAVPDYDAGIKILKERNISGMTNEVKEKLIQQLEIIKGKTKTITTEAEDKLTNSGYKLIKIPCFHIPDNEEYPFINYTNGVGGTSQMKGTYFITNTSKYPELDNEVSKIFKKNGIKNVYFVSTNSFLELCGGIDCLTQEI